MSDLVSDDRAEWDRIVKTLSKGDATMVLGWFDSAHEGGITNAALALIHEFGAQSHAAESTIMAASGVSREQAHTALAESGAGIPARAPLRTAWDANRDEYVRMLGAGVKQVIDGKRTTAQVLAIIGLRAETDVKNAIRASLPPPLKAATIAQKKSGNSTPLVDSGQFVNSIKSVVRKGPPSVG